MSATLGIAHAVRQAVADGIGDNWRLYWSTDLMLHATTGAFRTAFRGHTAHARDAANMLRAVQSQVERPI